MILFRVREIVIKTVILAIFNNKDVNVHRFVLSAITGELLEKERERERERKKREKLKKRERRGKK